MSQFDFDVSIIGGGPTAAYLAKAGLSCVVFERELFQRPHVGESLVPSSTQVFKEIGLSCHVMLPSRRTFASRSGYCALGANHVMNR